MSDAASAPVRGRHWHDYVGALVTIAITGLALWRAPRITMWMLPVYAFDIAAAVSFLVRGRAVLEEASWHRRVVAYAAGWGLPAFTAAAATWAPQWLEAAGPPRLRTLGYVFILGAVAWKLYALWYLRRAFSVEPAARELVTGGPYRFARHPIYTGHIVSTVGMLLMRPAPMLAAWCLVWVALLWRRSRYEEAVLEAAFPAYAGYRKRVGAFAPHLEMRLS
jgi:protein-S-isoprenylcysteine O-methyltransferase Ste14